MKRFIKQQQFIIHNDLRFGKNFFDSTDAIRITFFCAEIES